MREALVVLFSLLPLTLAVAEEQPPADRSVSSDSLKLCADISANPEAWSGKDVSLVGKLVGMEQKLPKDRLNQSIQRDPVQGTVSLHLPGPEELESYVVKRRFVCVAGDGDAGGQSLLFMTDKGSTMPGATPLPPPSLGSLWKVTGRVFGPQTLEVAGPSGKKAKRKVPYLVDVKLEPLAVEKQ